MDVGDPQLNTMTLIIKAPDQGREDQTIVGVHLSWTVKDLKTRLSTVYPSKPVSYRVNVNITLIRRR